MTALIFGLACLALTVALVRAEHRRKQADRRADAAEAAAAKSERDLSHVLNTGARWQG